MDKTLIVARMQPGAEQDIAEIFAASDSTELPERIGVGSRTLFRFHDLYMHLIEAEKPIQPAVEDARQDRLFRDISDRLSPFIAPYDPHKWRSPSDAMATAFYSWQAPTIGTR